MFSFKRFNLKINWLIYFSLLLRTNKYLRYFASLHCGKWINQKVYLKQCVSVNAKQTILPTNKNALNWYYSCSTSWIRLHAITYCVYLLNPWFLISLDSLLPMDTHQFIRRKKFWPENDRQGKTAGAW